MKKGSRFLIGFGAAALTFGSLMAGLGTSHFNLHGKRYWNHHGCYGLTYNHNSCSKNYNCEDNTNEINSSTTKSVAPATNQP